MNNHEYHRTDGDPDGEDLRVNATRDSICEWAMDYIVTLVNEERFADAHSVYEEFFHWLDLKHLNKELTIYTCQDDIKKLYDSIRAPSDD